MLSNRWEIRRLAAREERQRDAEAWAAAPELGGLFDLLERVEAVDDEYPPSADE